MPHLVLQPDAELSTVTVSAVETHVSLALNGLDGRVSLSPSETRCLAAALVAAAEAVEEAS